MNDQELHQLAKEYAESIKETVIGQKDLAMSEAEQFLTWLTKTHCIVSREKVMNLYQLANCDYGNDPDTIRTLEYIFGKSTFETHSPTEQ